MKETLVGPGPSDFQVFESGPGPGARAEGSTVRPAGRPWARRACFVTADRPGTVTVPRRRADAGVHCAWRADLDSGGRVLCRGVGAVTGLGTGTFTVPCRSRMGRACRVSLRLLGI